MRFVSSLFRRLNLKPAESGSEQQPSLLAPFREPNFGRFFGGSVLSMIGTQLTFVAFPWLVLKITGDPLAMGLVLAVEGVPRALFMAFGGAFTDRFSPRTVMVGSTLARAVVMLVLGALTLGLMVDTWMIFVAALAFGVLDAFAFPAGAAFVPQLLPQRLLPAGNAIVQGISQLTVMAGPAAAGLLIAWFTVVGVEADPIAAELPGIGIAFLITGLGLAIATVLLLSIRLADRPPPESAFSLAQILADVGEGLAAMWRDLPVRLITLIFTVFTLFWRGPYLVGIPVLAEARFEEGALAFGLIGSSFGFGALVGSIIAGSVRWLPERYFGLLLLADTAILGCSFFVYATTTHVEVAMAMTALCGLFDGYMVVLLISWLQVRVPAGLIGRVMSTIMLFNVGLAPVSALLAGWLITFSLQGMFFGAGACLVVLSIGGLLFPVVRTLGMMRPPPEAVGGSPASRKA